MIRDSGHRAVRLAALPLLALAACTPAAYLPGAQVVTVGDREHTVRRSGEGYTAQMNSAVFAGNATEGDVYLGNLRAIRDVTGCPVAVRSVVNENGKTTARLACPEGRQPQL